MPMKGFSRSSTFMFKLKAALNCKSMPLFSPLQLLRDPYVMVRQSDTLHQIRCVEAQKILDPLNSFTRSNTAASTLWKICIIGSQVSRSFLAAC